MLPVGARVFRRHSIKHDDAVSEVRRHDEIVLDDKCSFLRVQNIPTRKNNNVVVAKKYFSKYTKPVCSPLDDFCRVQTLFGVQVGRRFVDEVHISRFAQAQRKSDSLQLATGEVQHLNIYANPTKNKSVNFVIKQFPTNLLVVERLQLQWLDDVSDELRVHVCVSDLLMQQLSNRSLRLRTDLLRFVADVENGDLYSVVRLESSRHHADKRRLPGSVFAQHDDDFRVGELAFLDVELEASCKKRITCIIQKRQKHGYSIH